ncbi:MAG: cytochrome ubiquinol oxidase subunit I [bacterium]
MICLGLLSILLLGWAEPALAQELAGPDYRTFFGLDSRVVVWVVAQLHLMFGAFVLGVPLFAVIVEVVGVKTGEARYDRLAREFTKLLSVAFSTTAALGGLLTFTLFGLYPKFMHVLTGIFHQTFYIYGLLFFAEAFSLYLYYYSWDRLSGTRGKKWAHVAIGVFLNLSGVALMVIANSWTTFMMSPSGIEAETGRFIGTTWEAVHNLLWNPLNIHRFIANIAFGGFVVGAYAAVKFLNATTDEGRAHYDWMGYIGNFVGVAAIIPLPFAGYFLGREVYSASAVMGNNMMGGTFSWTFIIQALLIGILFIGANYYLWTGMERIAGAERYHKYIKYINVILIVSFAVWLTPHNLPLSAEEQLMMGGQYHPVLKYLGLMSGKNAAVNFIILSTFFSFLLYRRANKGQLAPFTSHGASAKVILPLVAAGCCAFLYWYASSLFRLDPATLELSAERTSLFQLPAWLLILQIGAVVAAVGLTFSNRGLWGQNLLFAVTTASAVFVLGWYGYVVMEKANSFLPYIAVVQVLMVISCLIVNTAIDVFLFRGAEELGGIDWGKIPVRSQYALIVLCVSIVLLMGLMGYVRSGLREDWHIYGVLRDTSPYAYTPTMAFMAKVVGAIVLLFLGLITFVFWLTELGEKPKTLQLQPDPLPSNPSSDGPSLSGPMSGRRPGEEDETS